MSLLAIIVILYFNIAQPYTHETNIKRGFLMIIPEVDNIASEVPTRHWSCENSQLYFTNVLKFMKNLSHE